MILHNELCASVFVYFPIKTMEMRNHHRVQDGTVGSALSPGWTHGEQVGGCVMSVNDGLPLLPSLPREGFCCFRLSFVSPMASSQSSQPGIESKLEAWASLLPDASYSQGS